MDLLVLKPEGLYCPQGEFFIDPTRKVKTTLLTHAHTDHAKSGSENYFCTKETKSLIQSRIKKGTLTAVPYSKKILFNDVEVSFHPAGHVLGSAQIRVEHKGVVWVVSGDYKRALDPTCKPFEVVKCHTFITETTFAQPNYTWHPTELIIEEIKAWHEANKANRTLSVLTGYKLGKSQRLIAELSKHIQVYYDEELADIIDIYKKHNISFNTAQSIESCSPKELQQALIVTATTKDRWWSEATDSEIAFVSGWMHTSSPLKRGSGFALSDHVDWPDLLRTIQETQAKRIITTHGSGEKLIRHLQNEGLHAHELGVSPLKRQSLLIDYISGL